MDIKKELLTLETQATESVEREYKRNEESLAKKVLSAISKASNTDIQMLMLDLHKLIRTNYNSRSITDSICNFADIGYFDSKGAKYWSGASRMLIKTHLQDRIEEQRNMKKYSKRIDEHGVDLEYLTDITIRFLDLLNHYHSARVHVDVLTQELNRLEDIVSIRNLITIHRLEYIGEENGPLIAALKKGIKDWYQESKHNFLEAPKGYNQYTYVKFYRYILDEDQLEILRELFLQETEEKVTELKDQAWKTHPDELISSAKFLRERVEEIESWE